MSGKTKHTPARTSRKKPRKPKPHSRTTGKERHLKKASMGRAENIHQDATLPLSREPKGTIRRSRNAITSPARGATPSLTDRQRRLDEMAGDMEKGRLALAERFQAELEANNRRTVALAQRWGREGHFSQEERKEWIELGARYGELTAGLRNLVSARAEIPRQTIESINAALDAMGPMPNNEPALEEWKKRRWPLIKVRRELIREQMQAEGRPTVPQGTGALHDKKRARELAIQANPDLWLLTLCEIRDGELNAENCLDRILPPGAKGIMEYPALLEELGLPPEKAAGIYVTFAGHRPHEIPDRLRLAGEVVAGVRRIIDRCIDGTPDPPLDPQSGRPDFLICGREPLAPGTRSLDVQDVIYRWLTELAASQRSAGLFRPGARIRIPFLHRCSRCRRPFLGRKNQKLCRKACEQFLYRQKRAEREKRSGPPA